MVERIREFVASTRGWLAVIVSGLAILLTIGSSLIYIGMYVGALSTRVSHNDKRIERLEGRIHDPLGQRQRRP